MRGLISLIFLINITFSESFILRVKNIEKNYEFSNLEVILTPIYKNVQIEKNRYLIEKLKPLEEKTITINYNFINPSNDKILVEIKDNDILLFRNVYDLKYKQRPKNFNFSFSKNTLNFYFPKEGLLKLKIFDISGRKIYSLKENVKPGIYKKDFSFLKPGNYFYEIEFDKKYRGKFIILKGEK